VYLDVVMEYQDEPLIYALLFWNERFHYEIENKKFVDLLLIALT
jgi:hypothetical protein